MSLQLPNRFNYYILQCIIPESCITSDATRYGVCKILVGGQIRGTGFLLHIPREKNEKRGLMTCHHVVSIDTNEPDVRNIQFSFEILEETHPSSPFERRWSETR